MTLPDDLNRLRAEYANRRLRLNLSDLYSWFNPAYLFTLHRRQRMVLSALRRDGVESIRDLKLMEMGCGSGGVLKEFLLFGASPDQMVGVDLLPDRLLAARRDLPTGMFVNAEGGRLPFISRSFDLVIQFTAVSSVLDAEIRANICREMLRVLQPAGRILWYDFIWNPANAQTRGIGRRELRDFFPSCTIKFRRITLAPPIARRVVPVSWPAADLLERAVVLNSHYLAVIKPA